MILLVYYFIIVFPPIYGCNALGILIVPSSFKLFSRKAINILGGATTVLFNVWAKYLPFSPFTRIFNLLAWASPKFEQLPTSKYFCCLGDQASTSIDLTFKSAKSPEQHSIVLTGMSRVRNNSTVYCQSFSNHSLLYSGLHTTIISCFSNWWIL